MSAVHWMRYRISEGSDIRDFDEMAWNNHRPIVTYNSIGTKCFEFAICRQNLLLPFVDF